MSYKIFGDSCLDLTEELKKDPRFEMIPLTLQVDDHGEGEPELSENCLSFPGGI